MTTPDAGSMVIPPSDIIDWNIFNQILMMDEDDQEQEFSTSIVRSYLEQAQSTFQKMDAALQSGDLDSFMTLGHFLKGSSASLGVVKVQSTCEEIQHAATADEAPADMIARVRVEFEEARRWLAEVFKGKL